MAVNFLVADMVARLNLASRSRYSRIEVRASKLCNQILMILWKNGVIESFIFKDDFIIINLKYYKNQCVLRRIELISKPSKRVFWTLSQLRLKHSTANFSGFFIVSTPLGLADSNYCLLSGHKSGEILLKISV